MNVFPSSRRRRLSSATSPRRARCWRSPGPPSTIRTTIEPCARQVADDELAERIEAIWNTSRGTYGWPRVHAQLRRDKVHVGGKRVARITRQRGLIGRCRRRWTKTTIADREATAVDRLKRAFGPGTIEIDRGLRGRHHIHLDLGGMGLPGDGHRSRLSARRRLGAGRALRAEVVCDALRMAIAHRLPAPGLIFHSARGTQPGFTWSSQRCLVDRSVGDRPCRPGSLSTRSGRDVGAGHAPQAQSSGRSSPR